MFCQNCGSYVTDGARFCGRCGQPLGPQPQSQPQPNPQPTYPANPQPQDSYQYQTQTQTPPQPDQQIQAWQPTSQAAPATKVKDDRSLAVIVLLSLVTCGIYSYYNIYTMAQDINVICADDNETTEGLGMYILLTFVTCGFYSLYWEYKLAQRIFVNAPRFGLSIQESGDTILLWRLLGSLICGIGTLYGEYLLIRNLNTLAHAYNTSYGLA